MGRYSGKILFSDMDGTLLDSASRVSCQNKEAIRTFIEGGGRFGIATGRCLDNARNFLEGVSINGYCILANGGLLYDSQRQQYLEEFGLPKTEVEAFLQQCIAERPHIGVQIYARNMSYFVSRKEYAQPEVVKDHLPVGFRTTEQMREMEWVKILFSGTEEELQWIMEQSAYLEKEEIIDRVRSATNYYEFLPRKINKGTMLSRLRSYIADTDIIYAVGDYYNDIDMIRQADVGIAMANAPEEVKNCADRICTHCNDSAIADIIENFM